MLKFNSIEEVVRDIKQSKIVIILDDEDRENEGDFVMAGSLVQPHHITFMATHGKGLICTPISSVLAKKFELNPMVTDNSSQYATAFTVTIDAKENISTGISSFDRSHTIQLLTKDSTTAQDFIRPGHIFPLIANPNGVLERAGHTEAAIDLLKIAGLPEVGIICEILKHDGTMMRRDDLLQLAQEFNIKISTIKHLQDYLRKKAYVDVTSDVEFPNKFGQFRLAMLRSEHTNEEHMLIYKGNLYELKNKSDLLFRIHSECFTGDVFSSARCDCGEQLSMAMKNIEAAGQGAVIYLRQEGRGIGLANKLKAYELQDKGMDTVDANLHLGFEADERNYQFAVNALNLLGVQSVTLMSNNPEKFKCLQNSGIKTKRHSLEVTPSEKNLSYLNTKKNKMGHLLKLNSQGGDSEYH